MKTQRVLTEQELNEQIRLSIKKNLLAYIKEGIPRSERVNDELEIWKQINTEMQIQQAALNRYAKLLNLMSPKERTNEINRLKGQLSGVQESP